MTSREEREKVIAILQKEKKTALHDNRWAFDYAISSIKTDLKYDLLYENEPIITLDELKEIREEIDQKQYVYMADEDYDEGIRFGLMLTYQSIDKKISELEGKE